ncbi:MAG: FAD-binding protein [Oscillospiraceae bacterium]|nr:FAD-binding protein [Oscillospiraceae bacterium]
MSNELSRRSFLKGAAATAVSAAFLGATGISVTKAKAAASYTPGTYTATATGMGTVTMTATFSEDAITDIVLDVSQETEGIGKAAAEPLIEQLLAAQGPEIDGVSGASLTSQAARECLKNCIAQATGTTVSAVVEDAAPVEHDVWYDAEYFAKPDPITDIAETVETDVVVVGAGNGGLVAAASTADLGAKVILVEKNATWITWAGEMGAYNSKIMNEKYGISYTDEELLEISNEICRYAGYECDQRLINLWLFNSGRTMDWFTDRMEEKGIHMFLETDMKDTRYMNKPQTHTVYENFEELGPNQMGAQLANPKWVEIIEEKGGTIMWEHTAKQLVQDESGRVTGIIVQDKDGKYIQINAAKGVILSTGGYGGNPEMMDALHYRDKDVICNNLGCAFAMGDGIKMAMWAGADIDRNHAGGVAFDRAAVALDHHTGAPYTTGLGDIWWPGSQPWLNLNTRGERFCNEDNTYDFHINSWLTQPGHYGIQVFDSNYWSDVVAFHTTICSRVVAVPGARNSEVLPNVMPCKDGDQFYDVYIKPALDSGKLMQADTLDELADKLGYEGEYKENFLKSIERYNELCDKGVDLDFGKMKKDMTPIRQAPFYGIAVGSWLLATMNGVRVNTNLEAITPEGNAIPGLYVIGNDMGGFFSNSYPQMFGGTAHGKTVCFARLASLHAVTGSIYED